MNFVTVFEKENNDYIYLNLDNVVAIYDNGCVITNSIINNGEVIQLIYNFDKENLAKIRKYINKDIDKKQSTLLCE